MLYKTQPLSEELFENPTSEYRAAPFWAWNSVLCQDELKEQIDIFKEMGFGGFHMHVRQGMETPYLNDEFMDAVACCVEKAKDEKMLAWLYDEDRWPSGYAGGMITQHKKYRQRFLLMTKQDRESTDDLSCAYENGTDYFLGAFDVELNKKGEMVHFQKIERNHAGKNKWYYFLGTQAGGEPRYNFQSYVDVMSKEAIDQFIQSTHEVYKNRIGEEFGKTVPAVFTDEPMLFLSELMSSGNSEKDARLAWTIDLAQTYEKQYGENIYDYLPELFFATQEPHGAITKYQYYRHISERFAEAYMDNIGKWCGENGIMFTGHMMGEDVLRASIGYNGDIMRMYKEMQLPGIDMLFDKQHYVTAKQCQSVVRQYEKEGMLSELYGVTGWDFDFRGHKFQGDWQACLGVTVRVPHLAWQTMKGEGKRDYPASIFYQSPWYREYKKIEDHFARVNTVMSRGTACVRVAVLHPVESAWLLRGSKAETLLEREEMESHFKELAEWLLCGTIDFDYLAESLLEDICKEGGNPLRVGAMTYDAIIVADCITLRPHTIQLLETFWRQGGKLLFVGNTPYMSMAQASSKAVKLVEMGERLPYSKVSLYQALEDVRDISIRETSGSMTENLIYQLREEGQDKWLFVANIEKPELPHITKQQEVCITIDGMYRPLLYNTQTGEIEDTSYINQEGKTQIFSSIYNSTSLLLKLERVYEGSKYTEKAVEAEKAELTVLSEADYELEEPNVLLLDMAQFSVDGGVLQDTEEMMRIDERVRKQLQLKSRRNKVVQPYVIKDMPEDHTLRLIFKIESQIEYSNPLLAIEHPEKVQIVWNGEQVSNKSNGYYVDKYISTLLLPVLKKCENVLEVTMPFGLRTDLESCYLLGDFGVFCMGRKTIITQKPKKLQFGSIVNQGLAFYGGNIKYHTELILDEDSDIEIELSYYRGALVKVLVDDVEQGDIIYAPYRLSIKNVRKGKHKITYILYGNRYNTFAALHMLLAEQKYPNITPDFWRSEGQKWSYEYQMKPMGILKTPIIYYHKKEDNEYEQK